jgi:hypothetical protein
VADLDTVIALSSVWTFCIVAVCGAFLFGLVWRRMKLTGTLADLGVALGASDDRAHMRDELATALGDSTTELPSVISARALGAIPAATRFARNPPGPRRHKDRRRRAPGVALIHDVALLDDQELLDGVSTW